MLQTCHTLVLEGVGGQKRLYTAAKSAVEAPKSWLDGLRQPNMAKDMHSQKTCVGNYAHGLSFTFLYDRLKVIDLYV